VLRPNPDVDPTYFAHFFKTRDYRQRVSALAAGININNLRNEHLDDMQIRLPPLSEQRRIAEVLDGAEALRAKRRSALAQLDSLIHAIFLDMLGDPITNPKRWPIHDLQDVLVLPLRNGLSPSNTGSVRAKVLTLSAITGDHFEPTAWKSATFEKQPPGDQSVDEMDFLICRGNGNRALVGKGHFPSGATPDVTFPDTMIALGCHRLGSNVRSLSAYGIPSPSGGRSSHLPARQTAPSR
jgi:type I restriction enzyme S subunit